MAKYRIRVENNPDKFIHDGQISIVILTNPDDDRIRLIRRIIQSLNRMHGMEPLSDEAATNALRY